MTDEKKPTKTSYTRLMALNLDKLPPAELLDKVLGDLEQASEEVCARLLTPSEPVLRQKKIG